MGYTLFVRLCIAFILFCMNLFGIVSGVTRFLATLTVIGDILIAGALIGMVVLRVAPNHRFSLWYGKLFSNVGQKGGWYILLVSGLATVGSLFYSEIAHFTPCILCWYQRIAMYPLVATTLLFLKRKTIKEWVYVLPAAGIGACIAAYHYAIQVISRFSPVPSILLPCSAAGTGPSCTTIHAMTYGYVSIPMMAFTAFLLILITIWCMRREEKKTE